MSASGFEAPAGSSGSRLYGALLNSSPAGSSEPVAKPAEAPKEEQPLEKPKVWSAALGFAPVVRKRAPAAKATPAALSTSYNVATIVSAPKLTIQPEELDGAVVSEPVVKAPALTLPETGAGEDVNGFRQTAAGKRAANADKKKRKKRRKNEEGSVTDFSAEYDPARPNDYAEWKSYCKWRKAEEREARLREEAEEYTSGSEEETRPNTRGKFFAPPTAFYAAPSDAEPAKPESLPYQAAPDSPPAFQILSPARQPSPPRMPPPPQPQSGEDAYARRMAMSAAQTGDDAYARRAALSVAASQSASQSGEDAFAARAAMSSQQPQASSSSVNAEEASARARAIAERLGKMASFAVPPPSMPPAQPMPPNQPAPPMPAPIQPEEEEEESRPCVHSPISIQGVSSAHSNPHAFAAKLMAKYGWKKGQGLGVSEDGMVNPLSVTQSGKKQDPSEPKQPLGFSTKGRGTIVSDQKVAKDQAEKQKYGEPSRIVLLRNVVGRNEVDDDLASEIGEEAGKHGYVERCKVHVMPFNVPDEQSVRIFVCFSGLVGAWKAVKELDGRLFGGRHIRATFFDEDFYARGAYGIGD